MNLNSSITLEGSSSLVSEFFECGLNSILYQRGLYPIDDFQTTQKYGVKVLTAQNPELSAYIKKIIAQLNAWINSNTISKLVIVIKSRETGEVLERWNFNIEVNGENGVPMAENIPPEDAATIKRTTVFQIRSILRQITASVSYLPELSSDDCTFNVLVYANQDVQVPVSWGDSGPNLIEGGGEHVRLNSFNTMIHKVDTFVAYKLDGSF